MPTLSVEKEKLFDALEKSYTDKEFDELCFEFGVELDEITSEREEALKSVTNKLSKQQIEALSDKIVYKIDVPANRYDLLCIEGLSRALKIFLGTMEAPNFTVLQPPISDSSPHMVMNVIQEHTEQIRPFVVCAVLKDITFTQERYDSFIDLQDQLHRNLCRQRTLVAIGTHDLDTLQPPFTYDARPPNSIQFVPLTHSSTDTSFAANDLLDHYEIDAACKHLKPYVPIIKDSPLYPVVLDANETVMSLPPIINGSKSKITLETTNVFIECTATDLTKANIVLDTVVAMFSQYCANPFTVHPVTVNYITNQKEVKSSYQTPLMAKRTELAPVNFCNSLIGINISPESMLQLCSKMQLGPAELIQKDDDAQTYLQVTVPPTRSDILHPVDIAEDIAIAYGFNNIVKRIPTTSTVGGEQPLHALSDLLREEIARASYTEVLTHGLCSLKDNFTALRHPISQAVHLSNPANIEYQVVRTTLLPGLLKTLQHNKSASFANGFKLFEISDIVLADDEHVNTQTIVGAKNQRHLCALYAGPTSGFEIIHGLVDRVMTLCEVQPDAAYIAKSFTSSGELNTEEKFRISRSGWTYTIQPQEDDGEDPMYFPGRSAKVLLTSPHTQDKQICIGTFGILHPEVLHNFDILYPTSSLELNLESLL
mmetsp:Transcript_13774/g.19696  ORF Transcript_13774/g.19696 Transcript_13774/m.19696 type:complete len:654 (-) Transcript_13774:309-2270(-)|eukprot:CAMPEP_0184865950 /NCGR_PEP_ID=MMETSP0580-20130426/19926_1 /TAXON_ID=1118495 /ORGANISM="Dactyliosolen fragilissimus" /LENGTH=653 /DNA_ID=CAMNT_0027365359 /DNA_START=43 /DNA_END=2004 /DNA_ORIENTATION=+